MKDNAKYVIEFQIYFLLLQGFLTSVFKLPSLIIYVLDLVVIFLLLYTILFIPRIKALLKIKPIKQIFVYFFVLVLAVVIVSVIRLVPVLQILWAMRNNLFFPLFFIFCIIYLRLKDVKKIMDVVVRFQIINFICAIFEYFVLHKFGDDLGGMFGITSGCNGILNVYLFIICAYVLARYFDKKESFLTVALVILSSIAVATLAELKIFYIEIILIFILQFLFGRKTLKGFFVLLVVVGAIVLGFYIFSKINPSSVDFFKSVDEIFNYNAISDYGYGDIRVPRFSFIEFINDTFFGGNVLLNLFGYGFGYCESSDTFSFFNSAFSSKYGYTQYRNLSSSMLYLETGIVGLLAVIGFFVFIFVWANNFRTKTKGQRDVIVFTMVLSIIVIINLFYNSAIRREISYLIFFAFSIFFVMVKEIYIKRKLKERENMQVIDNKEMLKRDAGK